MIEVTAVTPQSASTRQQKDDALKDAALKDAAEQLEVRIPEYPAGHSDNIRPPKPEYPATLV